MGFGVSCGVPGPVTSNAACPPPSCLRLGGVSVMSYFVLCLPTSVSLCSCGAGECVWGGGDNVTATRDVGGTHLPGSAGGILGDNVTFLPPQTWPQSVRRVLLPEVGGTEGWGQTVSPCHQLLSVPTGSSRSRTRTWWTMSPRSGRCCWSASSRESLSPGRRSVG